jgi:hypothetical protein
MTEKNRKKKIVYKITYPNGKIYIGKDLVYNINYFGSANGEIIEKDFSWEEQQVFEIKKEILWSSDNATDQEVNSVEVEYIRIFKANNPSIGYNRWPKHEDKKRNCITNQSSRSLRSG